ncbi:MAG: hypothetical protein SFX72_02635 [Isosphaeraceae bacterium]|nr:hypothetical protein [Isosphaeraceae bacterium]
MSMAKLDETSPPEVPEPIERLLRRVGLRLRLGAVARGLVQIAILGSLGAAIGMIWEFTVRPTGPLRWLPWSLWLGSMVFVAVRRVVVPALRRHDRTALAAIVERANPGLAEGLTTTLAFSRENASIRGSASLVQAHVHASGLLVEASRPASRVERLVDPRLVLACIGCLAICLVPTITRPRPFADLLQRFATPWRPSPPISPFEFVVEPGDRVVAVGADLSVTVTISRLFDLAGSLPSRATLDWVEAGSSSPRRLSMVLQEEKDANRRRFEITVPRIARDLRYRIEADGEVSRRFAVEAVEPAIPERVTIVATPPAYTKRETTNIDASGPFEVLEGSTLDFTIVPSKPVGSVALDWPGETESVRVEGSLADDRRSATAKVVADRPGMHRFGIRLGADDRGITSPPVIQRLSVRADAAPTLTVEETPATQEAAPTDLLGVSVEAKDDFGVASVEFHYQVSRASAAEGAAAETGIAKSTLAELGGPIAAGELSLPLAPLKLHPGDIVRYMIKVEDNRPAPRGPNVVWSEPFQLTIVERAEPILARRDRLHEQAIAERLRKLEAAAGENRREAEQLRYAADAAKRESKGWDDDHARSLARRESAAAEVRDGLREFAEDLRSDPTFHELARPAERLAELEAEAGRERLAKAAAATDAGERLELLRQADAGLGAVQLRLEEMKRRFEALAKLDADRRRLRDLAAKEDALAERLEAAESKQLDELLAAQLEAQRELDGVVERSPEMKAAVLAEQSDQAAKLAKTAEDLLDRQREEARKTAELAQPNERLREIVELQRGLEDDARRFALEVDTALAENGRARLDVARVSRGLSTIERGDLHGGRQALEDAERELRRLALEIDELIDDPKALARRLAQRQSRLVQQVNEALGDIKTKANPSQEELEALTTRLRPALEIQTELDRLARTIRPGDPAQSAAAERAGQAAAKAMESLRSPNPKEIDSALGEARASVARLADLLPDPAKRREPARKGLETARREIERLQRDLDRQLRETERRDPPNDDPIRRAEDMAKRIEPMPGAIRAAAATIAALQVEPAERPHRDRAEARLRSFAATVEALGAEAKAAGSPKPPETMKDWRLIGPFAFDQVPPFDPAKPVDANAPLENRPWKSVADGSRIDLGRLFGQGKDRSAFAVAEVARDRPGPARLFLGSDDTLAVWVNGILIHDFRGSRTFSPEAVKLDVDLRAGVNRIVARVGNHADRWEFGARISPPPPEGYRPERLEALRESIASRQADAREAVERLAQRIQGRTPTDSILQELATEQAAITPGPTPESRAEAAREQRRLAAALRAFESPDVELLRSEAARTAAAAAAALENAAVDPSEPVERAKEAVAALSDRVHDRISPKREAEALLRVHRALEAPDAQRTPEEELEIRRSIAQRAATLPNVSDSALGALARATRAAARIESPAGAVPDIRGAVGRAEAELRQLADSASDESPRPPGAATAAQPGVEDPELHLPRGRVAEATELARRERRIRERLQAVVGERIEPQESIREDSIDLARRFAELREESKATTPKGSGQAAQVEEILARNAPGIMKQGSSQLSRGQARDAGETQRRAAESLERAAQISRELASTLRAESEALRSQGEAKHGDSGVGEARHTMAEIARELSKARSGDAGTPDEAPASARDRASDARRAADALRSAAAKAPRSPGRGETASNRDGDPTGSDPSGAPIRAGSADLSALQASLEKQTGRKWGELSGKLRSEILQRAQGRYRDDYGRLIQLYFEEIARDGGR